MDNTAQSELAGRIAQGRKGAGLTQEQLADRLGVTYQAVSKWENDQCCPDILLLPGLAAEFGMTVDELLTGKASVSGQTPKPRPGTYFGSRDYEYSILLCRGGEPVSEHSIGDNPVAKELTVKIEQDIEGGIYSHTSVSCGDVEGNINAGAQANCGDVEGNVNAGAQVSCGEVEGNVNAGAQVNCGDVGGNASAGGNIEVKGDVGGNVKTGGNLTCGDIGGDVEVRGTIMSCGDVSGGIKVVK